MNKSATKSTRHSEGTKPAPNKAPVVSMPIKVIKEQMCANLSGKAQLTYHLGADHQSNPYLRVWHSTGSGSFSDEWVALSAIGQCFIDAKDQPIASPKLRHLVSGKSTNCVAYIMAILVAESLAVRSNAKPRNFERTDGKQFAAQFEKLLASKSEIKILPKDKPKKSSPLLGEGKSTVPSPTGASSTIVVTTSAQSKVSSAAQSVKA